MPTEGTILGVSGAWWLRMLFLLSVAVFAWRMSQLLRVLALGRWENRLNHIPLRIKTFLKEVMGQSRLFDEPVIGWAHPVIFWGFCAFLIASSLMLLGGMFPSLPIPQAEQIPVIGTVIDLFALLVAVGLVAAAIRRYFFTPKGLERTWDATIILSLIGGLMVTFVLAEAGGHGEEGQTWLPVGSAVAAVLNGLGMEHETLKAIGAAAWWVHALILLFFLPYLPYSKHMHLLWSPLAVFFAELPHKGQLLPVGEGAKENPAGEGTKENRAGELGLLTWRMLLSAYACAECGRCERACPAATSGSKLSPKDILHRLKEYVLKEGVARLGKAGANGGAEARKLVGDVIPAETLWGCTTCYACMELCPVRNEHVPLIVQMRRKLVEEGKVDPSLQDALTSLQRYGNSHGKSARKRSDWTKTLPETDTFFGLYAHVMAKRRIQWTKDLPVPLKEVEKEPVEMLWFLGDYASYHPSSTKVSGMVARVFQAAGLDFGVLTKGEKSAGNDVRRVGEEGLFEMLAEQNMEALAKADFKRILTTDPHTYHTLKHEYARFGLNKPVLHYSEVLAECLRDGSLTVKHSLKGRAVFHDPCYLGRINGIYDPPREVIRKVGLELVEMPRTRENSFCCGAGGGKIWMEEEEGVTERPAVNRIKEALQVEGVTHFVVACPKDLGMFEDAVKTAGAEDRLKIVDLGELVFQSTVEDASKEQTEPQKVGEESKEAAKVEEAKT